MQKSKSLYVCRTDYIQKYNSDMIQQIKTTFGIARYVCWPLSIELTCNISKIHIAATYVVKYLYMIPVHCYLYGIAR